MESIETAPYFETQQFIEDCAGLALMPPDDVADAKLAICLKWSKELNSRGEFPSAEAVQAQALFVLGDISAEDMSKKISLAQAIASEKLEIHRLK